MNFKKFIQTVKIVKNPSKILTCNLKISSWCFNLMWYSVIDIKIAK